MKKNGLFTYMKSRYVDPKYAFRDRLYFLFGTAGLLSAGAAFLAAVFSGLPQNAAVASLMSFFIMLGLMAVSFCMKNISVNRVICSLFLNFFMFPSLFWVTGGVNCGMVFYFILGLSVATLILEGKLRIIVLSLSLVFYTGCLYLGFRYPEKAYPLSYEERSMDTISSFLIVALFIIAVIIIMSLEYQKEHDQVLANAAELKQQAVTDNLTTLYNQRYLMSALQTISEDCCARGKPASIVMFDLDDFKKINDTFGHLRGNLVLCQFAAILKENAAGDAVAARYGGEEFILVLPGKDRAQAMRLAESIRLEARSAKTLQELTDSRFSVSGGVAQYDTRMEIEEWIRLSDTNLYAAKAGGKNRIVG